VTDIFNQIRALLLGNDETEETYNALTADGEVDADVLATFVDQLKLPDAEAEAVDSKDMDPLEIEAAKTAE